MKFPMKLNDCLMLVVGLAVLMASPNPLLTLALAVVLFAPVWLRLYWAVMLGEKKARKVLERKLWCLTLRKGAC